MGQFYAYNQLTGTSYLLTFFFSNAVVSGTYVSVNQGTPVLVFAGTLVGVPPLSITQYSPTQLLVSVVGLFSAEFALITITGLTTCTAVTIASPASSGFSCNNLILLDLTMYFIDSTGTIWNSGTGIGNIATWSGQNIVASQVPGGGVALASHQSLLVALKTASIEFFYDNANPPPASPLLSVPNSTIQWGCLSGNSVQMIEDNVYWLATGQGSACFVAMLQNRQHVKISTPGVDRLLDDVQGPYYSFSFKDIGHLYYGLTCVGSNITLVYDISEQIWYLWTDQNGNYWPWFGFASLNVAGLTAGTYCQNIGSGAAVASGIWMVDEEFYTDTDTTGTHVFTVDIYTPNYDSGSRRQDTLQRMDFIADQQPGILQSRWNEDDYAPGKWSQFRSVDLNQRRPTLTDNGSFRRRAWHFRWREPLPLRLEAVELDILPGTA
jgi:hypothetical protein